MPEHYVVRWAEVAIRDLEDIVSFVGADSPVAAERLLDSIESRARGLDRSPRRGRLVPELRGMGLDHVRELIVHPYRLVYSLHGRAVRVLAVLDGRRNLEDLLQDRVLRGDPNG